VANFAFDRCITCSDDAVDCPGYSISLNYEFIDDVYNDWSCDVVRRSDDDQSKGGVVLTVKEVLQIMEQKSTHTFSHMV
jgi:hypothetical protein